MGRLFFSIEGHRFPESLILRQVAVGTDFVQKTLDAFQIRSSKTNVLVDLYGYDGWAALACLQDNQSQISSVFGF